jgi:hypothetical protein
MERKLSWEPVSLQEKGSLIELLRKEGAREEVILQAQKSRYVKALIKSIDDVRMLVFHDLRSSRPGMARTIKDTVFPTEGSRTAGEVWDRFDAAGLQFDGDWFGGCAEIDRTFNYDHMRVGIGNLASEDDSQTAGGNYQITDGAHRTLVLLKRVSYGEAVFKPFYAYSTDHR